jgi:hypothetical protein
MLFHFLAKMQAFGAARVLLVLSMSRLKFNMRPVVASAAWRAPLSIHNNAWNRILAAPH